MILQQLRKPDARFDSNRYAIVPREKIVLAEDNIA
jgi:hypothetical protein